MNRMSDSPNRYCAELAESVEREWPAPFERTRFRRLFRNVAVAPMGMDDERDEEIRRIWRAAAESGR